MMSTLYGQLFARLPYPTTSYAGKTIVVTGSNTGLGKEAARHYARLGASKLILAVRSVDKGNAAKRDIETTTNCGTEVIQVWHLDMGSYASVQKFGARIDAELDRLDIFIANAGLAKVKFTMVEDNEETITVNVVSTFLLAALVMPKLKATAKECHTRPTLTITSSTAHKFTQLPQKTSPEGQLFANINTEKYFREQYSVSKMLEIFMVRSIAEKYPAPAYPVTVNCVCPGLCRSELIREIDTAGFVIALCTKLMVLCLARSTEYGSRTLVHAAAQGPESHGQYFSDCHVATPSSVVTEDKELQNRVWKELSGKLEAIKPGVMSNF